MQALEFEAGGRVHALRFDMNALCRIEESTGLDMVGAAKLLQPESGIAKVSDMRLFFQAGLVERLTLEESGNLMGEVGFEQSIELVVRAFDLAFAKGRAGGAAGTGTTRGKRKAAAV